MLLWIYRMQRTTAVTHTHTHTHKIPPILHVLVITYLELLEVGLIWSVLLMRTKQTLNKKEFVQELTEVVKKCVYACYQLPCFTEFRLNHLTPPHTHTLHLSLWYMQSFLQTTVFFIYTSISIPCFAFIYVVLIMRIIFFLSFYS